MYEFRRTLIYKDNIKVECLYLLRCKTGVRVCVGQTKIKVLKAENEDMQTTIRNALKIRDNLLRQDMCLPPGLSYSADTNIFTVNTICNGRPKQRQLSIDVLGLEQAFKRACSLLNAEAQCPTMAQLRKL